MGNIGTTTPDADPTLQRLMAQAHAKRAGDLPTRERSVESLLSAAFLAVAVTIAVSIPEPRTLDPALAVGLVAALALTARVEFNTGPGWTAPTQLVFVPMLFLVPLTAAPLLVLCGLLAARIPDYVSGAVSPRRALSVPADSWYAIGPALVLLAAGSPAAGSVALPVLAAALAAQFTLDLGSATVRARIGIGVSSRVVVQEMSSILLVDALLSPIAMLAALAAAGAPWRFVLVLPLAGLLAIFAEEREGRIKNALTLRDAYRGTAHLLGELLGESHEYTGAHSRSVVVLAHEVGAELGVSESVLREIEFGALLHDVGKMAVPNEILNKPTSLTEEEWTIMRRHTAEGERMLGRIGGVLAEVGTVIRSHHERFDGKGYPDGLRGNEIPLAARVISCCDAFNAMTTDRPYRRALDHREAVEELRLHSGTQFDPEVVEALLRVVLSS